MVDLGRKLKVGIKIEGKLGKNEERARGRRQTPDGLRRGVGMRGIQAVHWEEARIDDVEGDRAVRKALCFFSELKRKGAIHCVKRVTDR